MMVRVTCYQTANHGAGVRITYLQYTDLQHYQHALDSYLIRW